MRLWTSKCHAVAHGPKPQFRFIGFAKGKMSTTVCRQWLICTVRKWAFTNGLMIMILPTNRYIVPQADKSITLKDRKKRLNSGLINRNRFQRSRTLFELRCPNRFTSKKMYRCDACVDVCPDIVHHIFTKNEDDEKTLREKRKAMNLKQDFMSREKLKVIQRRRCLIAGLCA